MAQTRTGLQTLGPAQEALDRVDNTGISVGTTATTLISRVDVRNLSEFTVSVHNTNATETLTVTVVSSNKANPSTDLTTTDWAIVGSPFAVANNTAEGAHFGSRWEWVGVRATATLATTTDVDCHLLMSRL